MKQCMTAIELTALAQSKLMQIQEVNDDNAEPVFGLAYWHERDEYGCNWNICTLSNGKSYIAKAYEILDELRKTYDILEK